MKILQQDKDLEGKSTKWANWMSKLSVTTCEECFEKHGTIVDISNLRGLSRIAILNHIRCKCFYVPMRTKKVETATNAGSQGADAYLFYLNRLPPNYVDKKTARKAGWKDYKGDLDSVLPGKMIGGDVYRNDDGKLPSKPNRIWYEADINYTGGYRNTERILYSNDGLIFVTYDHYHTFYEITA